MITFVYRSNMYLDATVTDATGDPVDSAAVVATLIDREGVPVVASGVTWPVTLTGIGGGVYRYETPTALAEAMLVDRFKVQVLATVGSWQRFVEEHVYVQKDTD